MRKINPKYMPSWFFAIKAIILFEQVKARYEVKPEVEKEIEFIIEQPKKDVCPYCSCEQIFKRGQRQTKIGVKQLYCCKSCKRRFAIFETLWEFDYIRL